MDFAFLDNVTPEAVVLEAAALAIALSKGKDSARIDLLGDFFSAVGENLSLIAAKTDLNTETKSTQGGQTPPSEGSANPSKN